MLLITILAILGLAVSVAAHRKRGALLPSIGCDTAGCDTVLHSRQAALFAGLPNTIIGMVWYAVLLLWSMAAFLLVFPLWLPTLLTLGAAAALAISIYLAATLLFVLKQPCPLCFTAHAINAAILVVFLLL